MKAVRAGFFLFALITVFGLLTCISPGEVLAVPSVFFTLPANGSGAVATNDIISAIFSDAMDPATLNNTSFSLNNAVTGTVAYDSATKTATFIPDVNTPLSPNTTYVVTITGSIKNSSGAPLAAPYIWSFTTGSGSDTIAPVVTPGIANGATNIPLNSVFTAVFSEDMNVTSVTPANFTVNGTNGAVSYDPLTKTATFIPSLDTPLVLNTSYIATIRGGADGVKDLAGNQMSGDVTWNFTTGQSADTTAPSIVSTNPAAGATDVVTDSVITAVFSEDMNETTINTATFIVEDSSGSLISGVVTFDHASMTAVFTPASSLLPNITYTATITSGATDLAGNAVGKNGSWSFTTATQTSGGIKCFIATAAYGSYLDPHVKVLRDFRDRYLLTNAIGTRFVNFYYENSPPLAGFIARHRSLRLITRWALTPVIYIIEYPLSIVALIFSTALIFRKRKKGPNPAQTS